MKFRPCIDIHNGFVKQIVGGSLKDLDDVAKENYVSSHDGAYYGNLYKQYNLRGGHIILLNPSTSNFFEATKKQALSALNAYKGGLQIGGGINDTNAMEYLNAGASHVIVTSYVFKDGKINFENLKKIVDVVGKERLVLDLSCRRRIKETDLHLLNSKINNNIPKKSDMSNCETIEMLGKSLSQSDICGSISDKSVAYSESKSDYYIVTDRWQNFTDTVVNLDTLELLEKYCDEFLVHAVDVEGKVSGIEAELAQLLGKYDGNPITYAGGVSSLADLELLKNVSDGKLDVTIGSALDIFGGNLPFEDVIKYMKS